MIGIPFADSEDFMGGITTTGTVQIELRGTRIGTANQKKLNLVNQQHCSLKIVYSK